MKISPATFWKHPHASPGEQILFEKLSHADRGQDWTVLHSLEISNHVRNTQGEADFIFMIPSVGILVLEVKAHRTIKRTELGWHLGQNIEERGPFKQASEAMHSVMAYLKERGIDFANTPFVYAVWATHVTRDNFPESIEWHDEQLLTSEDLKDDIVEVIENTTRNLVKKLGRHYRANPAPATSIEKISTALLPLFTAQQNPKDRQREIQASLDKALSEQIECVSLVKEHPAVLLDGMAGTGKTHIAIHLAMAADQEKQQTTLFLCYNKLLARFLKDRLRNYSKVKVSTIHALMLEVAEMKASESATSEWWQQTLPDVASDAINKHDLKQSFDNLIIDEAQDVGTEEFMLFLDQFLVEGLAGTRVFLCGDFKHQGIYMDSELAIANYDSFIPNLLKLSPLKKNCRNTESVGQFLNTLLSLKPGYVEFRRQDNDGLADVKPILDSTQFKSELRQILTKQLLKYSPSQIVILSSQKMQLEEKLAGLPFGISPLWQNRPNTIRYGSVQEFKGMEAMCVVLVEFEDSNSDIFETLYLGSTRSINDLVVVMTLESMKKLSTGERHA